MSYFKKFSVAKIVLVVMVAAMVACVSVGYHYKKSEAEQAVDIVMDTLRIIPDGFHIIQTSSEPGCLLEITWLAVLDRRVTVHGFIVADSADYWIVFNDGKLYIPKEFGSFIKIKEVCMDLTVPPNNKLDKSRKLEKPLAQGSAKAKQRLDKKHGWTRI